MGRAATPPLRDSAVALPDLCRVGPGSGPGPEVQWWSLSLSSLSEAQIVSQRARQSPGILDLILLRLFPTRLILFLTVNTFQYFLDLINRLPRIGSHTMLVGPHNPYLDPIQRLWDPIHRFGSHTTLLDPIQRSGPPF